MATKFFKCFQNFQHIKYNKTAQTRHLVFLPFFGQNPGLGQKFKVKIIREQQKNFRVKKGTKNKREVNKAELLLLLLHYDLCLMIESIENVLIYTIHFYIFPSLFDLATNAYINIKPSQEISVCFFHFQTQFVISVKAFFSFSFSLFLSLSRIFFRIYFGLGLFLLRETFTPGCFISTQ